MFKSLRKLTMSMKKGLLERKIKKMKNPKKNSKKLKKPNKMRLIDRLCF